MSGRAGHRERRAAAGAFGSIVGALVGGTLLSLGWGFTGILSPLAAPALCAAAILFTQARRGPAARLGAAAH